MKLRHVLATGPLLLALIPLTGCNEKAANSTAAVKEKPADYVAIVNDDYISRKDFNDFLTQRQTMQPGAPINPNAALTELVNMELLRQEAEKAKLDQREDIALQLKHQRDNVIVQTLVREYVDGLDYSDEILKAEYNKVVGEMGQKEFKASHILLKTEDEAKAVIAELDKGADFATLAKEKSTGPTSVKGGDLGWFAPQNMVPPFSLAVQNLEKGKYTKEPVKTNFGWHVILLEDSRTMEPPKFEDMKAQLKNHIAQQKVTEYIDNLNAKAKIQLTLEKPQAKPQAQAVVPPTTKHAGTEMEADMPAE